MHAYVCACCCCCAWLCAQDDDDDVDEDEVDEDEDDDALQAGGGGGAGGAGGAGSEEGLAMEEEEMEPGACPACMHVRAASGLVPRRRHLLVLWCCLLRVRRRARPGSGLVAAGLGVAACGVEGWRQRHLTEVLSSHACMHACKPPLAACMACHLRHA